MSVTGAVYISTEDVFPSKRLHQLTQYFVKNQTNLLNSSINPSDNVFIEHAADVVGLFQIIFKINIFHNNNNNDNDSDIDKWNASLSYVENCIDYVCSFL